MEACRGNKSADDIQSLNLCSDSDDSGSISSDSGYSVSSFSGNETETDIDEHDNDCDDDVASVGSDNEREVVFENIEAVNGRMGRNLLDTRGEMVSFDHYSEYEDEDENNENDVGTEGTAYSVMMDGISDSHSMDDDTVLIVDNEENEVSDCEMD